MNHAPEGYDEPRPAGPRHVVITVHGIRTFGFWQERLEHLLKSKDENIRVINYKYGRFSLVAFFIPFLRWLVTRRFREELLREAHRFPDARIDLVGHSFGTHLIGWGLLHVAASRRPKIHTIILSGSVLRPGFPWGRLKSDGSIGRLINECGTRDLILVLNQIFVLFTGVAGLLGFKGMTSDEFRNNWYRVGHSGYFLKHGEEYDQFMAERWVPLLATGDTPARIDKRPKTAIYSFWIFLLQNLEFVKLAAYAAIATSVYIGIDNSIEIRSTNAARDWAARSQRMLVEQPSRLAEGLAFAVKSINNAGTVEGDLALRQALRLFPPLAANIVHGGSVTSLAFNPDDSELATVTEGNLVRLWRVKDGSEIAALKEHAAVTALAFTSKGAGLWIVTDDGRVTLWTGSESRNYGNVGHEAERAAIYARGGEPAFATAVHDFTVHLWPDKGGPELILDHGNRILSIAFSGDGRWLATAGYDLSVHVWSASDPKSTSKQINNNHPVSAVALTQNGDLVAFGDTFGTVHLWDPMRNRQNVMIDNIGWIESLAFSPDGRWLASAGRDGTARIWDTETGQEQIRMVHEQVVTSAAFSHDGLRIATGSRDGTARVWNIGDVLPVKSSSMPCAMRFNADGSQLAVGDTYGNVQIVRRAQSPATTDLRTVDKQEPAVLAIGFAPSGKGVVAFFGDGTLRTWRSGTSTPVDVIRLRQADAAALSSNGMLIATGDRNGDVRLFRASDGGELASSFHPGGVLSVAVSSDGRYVASSGSDNDVRVWEGATGRPELEIKHDAAVTAISFSSNGMYVATGAGRTARVWKLQPTGPTRVAELLSESTVGVLAFSPNGRLLLTTGTDKTARIWDWASGVRVAEIGGYFDAICSAAFSVDGSRVAVGDADGTARVWPTLPAQLATEACERLNSYARHGISDKILGGEIYRNSCLIRQ